MASSSRLSWEEVATTFKPTGKELSAKAAATARVAWNAGDASTPDGKATRRRARETLIAPYTKLKRPGVPRAGGLAGRDLLEELNQEWTPADTEGAALWRHQITVQSQVDELRDQDSNRRGTRSVGATLPPLVHQVAPDGTPRSEEQQATMAARWLGLTAAQQKALRGEYKIKKVTPYNGVEYVTSAAFTALKTRLANAAECNAAYAALLAARASRAGAVAAANDAKKAATAAAKKQAKADSDRAIAEAKDVGDNVRGDGPAALQAPNLVKQINRPSKLRKLMSHTDKENIVASHDKFESSLQTQKTAGDQYLLNLHDSNDSKKAEPPTVDNSSLARAQMILTFDNVGETAKGGQPQGHSIGQPSAGPGKFSVLFVANGAHAPKPTAMLNMATQAFTATANNNGWTAGCGDVDQTGTFQAEGRKRKYAPGGYQSQLRIGAGEVRRAAAAEIDSRRRDAQRSAVASSTGSVLAESARRHCTIM